MKNQLILALIALALVATVRVVSAEPFEKDVVVIDVKNMKSGYKLAHLEFKNHDGTTRPTKILRKACNGERNRECLYKVEGKKETKLYDFNPDWVMVSYTYETKIEIARR